MTGLSRLATTYRHVFFMSHYSTCYTSNTYSIQMCILVPLNTQAFASIVRH